MGIALLSKDKLESFVQDLIKQGEVNKEEGRQLLENLLSKAETERHEFGSRAREEIQRLIKNSGVAQSSDIEALQIKIAELEEKIARLEKESGDA